MYMPMFMYVSSLCLHLYTHVSLCPCKYVCNCIWSGCYHIAWSFSFTNVCMYAGMDQGVVARARSYNMNFKVIVACSLTILFMFMLKQSSNPSEQVINWCSCQHSCVMGILFSFVYFNRCKYFCNVTGKIVCMHAYLYLYLFCFKARIFMEEQMFYFLTYFYSCWMFFCDGKISMHVYLLIFPWSFAFKAWQWCW